MNQLKRQMSLGILLFPRSHIVDGFINIYTSVFRLQWQVSSTSVNFLNDAACTHKFFSINFIQIVGNVLNFCAHATNFTPVAFSHLTSRVQCNDRQNFNVSRKTSKQQESELNLNHYCCFYYAKALTRSVQTWSVFMYTLNLAPYLWMCFRYF